MQVKIITLNSERLRKKAEDFAERFPARYFTDYVDHWLGESVSARPGAERKRV